MELTEREATRRMDEQRAKTAPTAVTALSSMIRAHSQPAIPPHVTPTASLSAREKRTSINYDEMWSHSFALRASQHTDLLPLGRGERHEKKKQTKVVFPPTGGESSTAPGTESTELQRLANSELDMASARAANTQTARRKTHRLAQTILPRKGQSVDTFNFATR
jgi:hypothetical protein